MKKRNIYYLNGIYYNLIKNEKGGGSMNSIDFQFSIFGEFSYIKASIDNIIKIMDGIKQYSLLPSTITNKNIDVNTNKIISENRIAFTSEDQTFNFRINNDRIDFNYNKNMQVKDNEEYKSFIEEKIQYLKGISSKLIDIFDIKSNRFAINTNILGQNIINNKEKDYFIKNIIPFEYYKEKNVIEWSYSSTARDKMVISGRDELLNIITTLSLVTNTINSEKRLICHFDINTLQSNEYKFTKNDDINDFFEGAKSILIKLFENFKDCDKNE